MTTQLTTLHSSQLSRISCEPVNVLVVDDRTMIRDVVVWRMRESAMFDIVAATTPRDLIMSLGQNMTSDIILLFVNNFDDVEWDSLISHIRTHHIHTQVIVSSDDDRTTVSCLEAGAVGYVNQDLPWEEFEQRLLDVYRGRQCCSPQVLGTIVERIQKRAEAGCRIRDDTIGRLSTREAEVACLLSSGRSNKEISNELQISVSTTKNHVHSVLQKIGVRRRYELLGRMF